MVSSLALLSRNQPRSGPCYDDDDDVVYDVDNKDEDDVVRVDGKDPTTEATDTKTSIERTSMEKYWILICIVIYKMLKSSGDI